jgi:threonine synthase
MNRLDLECSSCSYRAPYLQPLVVCPRCGKPWFEARYPYDELHNTLPALLRERAFNMWRYRELLPLRNESNRVSMGEGGTPLVRLDNLALMMGRPNLFAKDERQGPTGSFKDRQASLAVSVMKENGINEVVVASTGNVAISYSAYCARASIKLWAFLSSLVAAEKMREVALYGTEVVKITGTYDQAKEVAATFAERKGLYLDRGIRSFAARESMKTLAFEICEQMGAMFGPEVPHCTMPMRAPDWYFQAISGGLGPVGVWKGFCELREMGFIRRLPRLACIQAEGCAPIVNSFRAGLEAPQDVLEPKTHIITLATARPGEAYAPLRRAVIESDGVMETVTDEESYRAMHALAKMEGISMEAATGATFAGLFKLISAQIIKPEDVVIVNCSGHTLPVQEELLGQAWSRSVDVSTPLKGVLGTGHPRAAAAPVPPLVPQEEGLLAALERLDERVKSVAIIDDDPNAVRLLKRILQVRGQYILHEATNGREGLEVIRRERPDLVLLDLYMPDLDGFGLLQVMKEDETLHDIPVIVVSAKELSPNERKRLAGQVQALLQKGNFSDQDLLRDIHAAI